MEFCWDSSDKNKWTVWTYSKFKENLKQIELIIYDEKSKVLTDICSQVKKGWKYGEPKMSKTMIFHLWIKRKKKGEGKWTKQNYQVGNDSENK